MRESDSWGTGTARELEEENKTMGHVGDNYIREQLEKRRQELTTAITASAEWPMAPFEELLRDVDSALHRMDDGSFGICTACNETIEKERLIADPLVRLCLDHLTNDDRRALERDLELTSRVQRGLLPEPIVRSGEWNIHYEYKPAGLVSGDYCDLIVPRDENGQLIFLLGDVAGKGVAASMLMTHLHAMFRSLSGVGLELGKVLETANRVFCESTFAGQYATLIYGRAGSDGELELASAGHLPALHVAREGVKEINATGLPLGMFSTSRYKVHKVRLEPGDSLLLYTDGISEARNGGGTEYGVRKLANVARERHGWVPQELLAACLKDVDRHSTGVRQADDQTMMVIHRNDSAGIALND